MYFFLINYKQIDDYVEIEQFLARLNELGKNEHVRDSEGNIYNLKYKHI